MVRYSWSVATQVPEMHPHLKWVLELDHMSGVQVTAAQINMESLGFWRLGLRPTSCMMLAIID